MSYSQINQFLSVNYLTESDFRELETLAGMKLIDRIEPAFYSQGRPMYSTAAIRQLMDAGLILQTR